MTTATTPDSLPVAVIGAGPVGLAAAASLAERDIDAVVIEAGTRVGANVAAWSHVRLFTPWHMNIDPVAANLLSGAGWVPPDPEQYPTGADWRDHYLEPLAELPEIARMLELGTRVVTVARDGAPKTNALSRDHRPFLLTVETGSRRQTIEAAHVIDASGTWQTPNPLGGTGTPALGEPQLRPHLRYGIPDVLGAERDRYAGRHVAVVGSGHSAQQVVQDLAQLADEELGSRATWILRTARPQQVLSGPDPLPARAQLGATAHAATDTGRVELVTGFVTRSIEHGAGGFQLSDGERDLGPYDEVVVATGFQPDITLLRELQTDLDPRFEAPRGVADIIDPALHSCSTVPVHGWQELAHPEPGLWIVGMKSYGRAPTFLASTGYAQVRSVVDRLATAVPDLGATSGTPAFACGTPAVETSCCGVDTTASATQAPSGPACTPVG